MNITDTTPSRPKRQYTIVADEDELQDMLYCLTFRAQPSNRRDYEASWADDIRKALGKKAKY